MKDDKQISEEVLKLLLPKVQEAIKGSIEGDLAEKIPSLKNDLQNELWDKAVAEIGKRLNLPKELIEKLQQIDDIVKKEKELLDKALEELVAKVDAFKDKLKGVDLYKTVTMTYDELQKIKVKSATSWGIVTFFLGFFSGIVSLVFWLGLVK